MQQIFAFWISSNYQTFVETKMINIARRKKGGRGGGGRERLKTSTQNFYLET